MTIPHPRSAPYFISLLCAITAKLLRLCVNIENDPDVVSGSFQETTLRDLPAASTSVASSCAAVAAGVSAAATKIASRAVFHRARLIYRERASTEVLSVPRLNRLLCFLVGRHFDESET